MNIFSKKRIYYGFLITYIVIICIFILGDSYFLFKKFPNLYTWKELFINYEGGFLRRGLIGEILYSINAWIPIRIPVLLFSVMAYVGFTWLSWRFLRKVFSQNVLLLFFMTPTLFLMPVFDPYIFGRKDIFIHILLLCIVICGIKCHNSDRVFKYGLLISICYLLGMMIHEMIIFYFPLAAIFWAVTCSRQKKLALWIVWMAFLVFGSLAVVILYSGTDATRNAIVASWQRYYPLLVNDDAFAAIGRSFEVNLAQTFQHHKNFVTLISFLGGIILTAMPFMVVCKIYRPWPSLCTLFGRNKLLWIIFWLSICGPLSLPILFTDFGRHVSSAGIIYLLFLGALFSIQPAIISRWGNSLEKWLHSSWQRQNLFLGILILYSLSWRMVHYKVIGESYLKGGIIFHLF